jgi:Family of unknown function (DUF6541)
VLSRARLWLLLCGASPLLLLVGRLLPAEGIGLALRLTGAAACVLLLPGAFVVRATGSPRTLGVALAAALAWSLAAVFAVLVVLFAVSGTLGLGVGLLAATMVAGFALSLRTAAPAFDRTDLCAVVGLTALGVVLGGLLWWATGTIGGSLGPTTSDALFHLARIRKLEDAGPLTSVGIVNELSGAHVHPGYAFPLWHGALALVARLAGVDPELVLLYLPPILVPLAVLLAYGAGTALFRTWAGGIAAAAGQLALVAFARGGVGWLQFLSQPGGAARLLLVPGLLALAFAYLEERRRATLGAVAAGALGLVVVHPTYVVYVALPLAGFLLARAILSDGADTGALLTALGAVIVPAGLFLAWLAQFLGDTGARPQVRFTLQVETVDGGLRLRPEQLAFGSGIKVAALVAVPLALLAGGRRWAAYVLGAPAVLGVVALVPPAFETLSDAVSLSQAVRLGSFLPLPFALAGAALLAGRFGAAGVTVALAAALGFELAYGPGATGAGWAVWFAALAATCGLAVCGFLEPLELDRRAPARWAAAAAAALVIPVAVGGMSRLERWDDPDPYALTPGLVSALDKDVRPLSVVLAPSVTSYRLAGDAAVRIVVAPPGHVAFNTEQDYRARSCAAREFFLDPSFSAAARAEILRRYRPSWVVVDKTRGQPALPPELALVYEDDRYALYRVEKEGA